MGYRQMTTRQMTTGQMGIGQMGTRTNGYMDKWVHVQMGT